MKITREEADATIMTSGDDPFVDGESESSDAPYFSAASSFLFFSFSLLFSFVAASFLVFFFFHLSLLAMIGFS
jgi:hypothetical protein